ncbi:phosphate transport regulator [Sulfolobus sp. A20]|uniref:phosphate transport regulator n=1 Tax=Saccharolobus sp. A20 TaxID=1891280 RepID=UPI000845D17A|nr:phosphate transport regulator [Sulfolobus sp. A20]TRM82333.1 phosphate transport regulator [Sulfolobus sp. D5]TRM87477.1 phosphate transport regulator [Sulfolobus sp. E3]TRM89856.1 phosphate transport regulator [Sulfolobus sp. C3]TRM99590.1 phosphate transport regulator [Sulfolobus sp. E1]AOL15961.1 phosphate transport regulator [Sulfolobus sp. A20]
MSGGIAEIAIEEQLQQISLKILDEVRTLYELLSNMANSNLNYMQVYAKINGIKNEVESNKYRLGEYIFKIREGLLDKDLYVEILNNLEKIGQNIDSASYRLSVLLSKNSNLDSIIYKLLVVMCEKIITSFTHFIEALRLLSVNPKNSLENAKNVVKIEQEVDDLYRSLELVLFEKNIDNFLHIMLLKDVADRLEDSEDLLKVSADDITYIAYERI